MIKINYSLFALEISIISNSIESKSKSFYFNNYIKFFYLSKKIFKKMLLNTTPTRSFETIFCFNIDNYIYSQ